MRRARQGAVGCGTLGCGQSVHIRGWVAVLCRGGEHRRARWVAFRRPRLGDLAEVEAAAEGPVGKRTAFPGGAMWVMAVPTAGCP